MGQLTSMVCLAVLTTTSFFFYTAVSGKLTTIYNSFPLTVTVIWPQPMRSKQLNEVILFYRVLLTY